MDNVLDIDTFVERALTHPSSYFFYLLESLIEQPVQKIREELKKSTDVEKSELEAFLKLNWDSTQERLVWRDNVQTSLNRLTQEMKRIEKELKNMNNILNFLTRLRIKFLSRKEQFSKEIDAKITLLGGYELSLQLQLTNLIEQKKLYNLLLLKLQG